MGFWITIIIAVVLCTIAVIAIVAMVIFKKSIVSGIKNLWEKFLEIQLKRIKDEEGRKTEEEGSSDGLEDYTPPYWTRPISLIVNLLGFILFGGLTYLLAKAFLPVDATNWYFVHGAVIWVFVYIAQGLMVVNENEFLVIERFGQFYRIKMTGGPTILCLRGIIDKVTPHGGKGDFRSHRIDLYSDESGNEIDFLDGSAPIRAQIWYQIERTARAVYRWTYRVEDSENRIEEVFDGIARPLLQQWSIDESQKNLSKIASLIIDAANETGILVGLGVKLDSSKKTGKDGEKGGFIITDIVLPSSIKELREQTLKGLKDAEAASARGRGYFGAIKAVIEGAKEIGIDLEYEQAKELFETQRGLETIQQTGSNITFVGDSVSNVLKTLEIGRTKK